MKTIGLIDYYISEWHANKYLSILDDACKAVGEEFKIAYAYGELDVSLYDGLTTEEWCKKNDVIPCSSIKEVCERADYIMILAPSNPEKHLEYAKEAFKYGKNIYIDKTFAQNLDEAKEIYAAAEKYGAKFFTSSALRYASELADVEGAKHLIVTGGGGNFPEYVIHQAEMAIKVFGDYAEDVSVTCQGAQRICHASFSGGRSLTMIYAPSLSYTACAEMPDGSSVNRAMASSFFNALLADVLHFFLTDERSFPAEQTLAVMDLRDKVLIYD